MLAITVSAVAISGSERPMAPMVSCVKDMGTTPAREINPRVGRRLKRLLALAGLRREFTVSVPVPKTANDAATAAPVPPELPPGVLRLRQNLDRYMLEDHQPLFSKLVSIHSWQTDLGLEETYRALS